MLNDAPATADDAPPLDDTRDEIAIRGVIVIRDFLASPRLSRDEISERKGLKFHHLRNVPMSTTDVEARKLVEKYGGLIWMIVSEAKFNVRRQSLMDRDDMFAIGCAIMVQSAEMYEEGRGTKLSTWIAMRVRQGLMAVVKELHGSIREGGRKGCRTARGEELAYARGEVSPWVYLESLSTPVGEDIALLDTLPAETESAHERLEFHQEREWLTAAIEEVCDERERDIVYRMLAGEHGQSIADRHEITRQRVDQIHQDAIAKLARRRRIEDVKRERALRSPSA